MLHVSAGHNVSTLVLYPECVKFIVLVYTNITSESDPHSYEATKAVAKKAQKKFCGLGLESMTSVILVQCSTN